jgi:hypothetical protein
MVQIRIDLSSINKVLHDYNSRAQNLPTAFISQVLASEIEDVISTQGGAGTEGKWDPFQESTLERHPRRRGGTLLQDTGLLANIQGSHDSLSGTAESPARYAGWHVTGTSKMERRNFLAIDIARVSETISDYMLTEIETG